MSKPNEKPALILTGPTGIGKTALAVELALRHPFELISADSMQVYRGMEIGTAQPTQQELRGVPIHCVGMWNPDEPFNVKKFLDLSDAAHEAIVSRGRIPLYVGGTGMYLRALRWGLFDQPDIDIPDDLAAQVRERLQLELARQGPELLYERLLEIDPVLAANISPHDSVRVIRGLEVVETTGQRLSDLQGQWDEAQPRFDHGLIVLNAPRRALIERIERRVDDMLNAGWVDEVQRLLDVGFSPDLHCFKALGYREIVRFIRGEISEDALRERIKARTRQFSKRQMTWFRKERDARWIESKGKSISEAMPEIEKYLETFGIVA